MSLRSPSLLFSVLALVTRSAFAQEQRPTKVDDTALRTVAQGKGEEWLSYGFTPQETRYSPLSQINASNVSRLGLAWSYEVGPGGGGQEATPLVHNGVIFSITQWSVVFAVDARTHKEKWRWDPEVNQAAVRAKICCGVVHRGIAIYDGKIIAPAIDGRLFALDEETGKPVWEARVAYPQDNYTITIAPRIAKGKAIVGVSGADYPVRGFIAAFDAKTGAQAWKFYTVPGPGDKDPGLIKAAATWPKNIVGGGGGAVWDAISYDPELELVYIGTGNAGPWSEDARKSKGFDLLYAASIVAVDVNTGLYRWHFQNVPGDEWDFDSVQHLLQADVTVKGVKRKVIMQANKNGFLYTLERTNGKFISATPIAKINWALGLDEGTGRPIVNPEAKYSETESASVTPGPGGAHNWSPMSFNPTLGLLYVSGNSGGSFTYADLQNFEYDPNRLNEGVVFRGRDPDPKVPAKQRPELKSIGPSTDGGFLIAYDPATGSERWRVPGGSGIGGGTVATAGGIVFQVTRGTLYAYSADKGAKLLELKTGVPGGMGPPITFMVDGKQYVALQVGTGRAVRTGAGAMPLGHGGTAPPANSDEPHGQGAGTNNAQGGTNAPQRNPDAPPPVNPRLLVYTLDGTAQLL
jgi:PQQ-dependent dehydrogenase (methanol/ethanol family)